ncbi:alpha/beta hydrolase [Haloarculaceae archaeon H-GB2-1]|nr:dienelactone hydrolase family protein [Haloarculaceae archaeon H-GB1-1]MEA5386074.1 alpha/beta hydrolase [Haloarculaceae archaeon H-GB11]MEA5407581.1 alpha/beta hydrolase [Haloarculaceae archaeon H-GB2-1]
MSERVVVPGARKVVATLDDGDADSVVVACPPHPQFGGNRSDSRLTAVGEALGERGIACLRFDYGPWDEGRGERTDALDAIGWARDRYDAIGLFGYSFGASVALVAASESRDLRAVSVLSPGARVVDDADVVAALDRIEVPTQVVYGERDETVDWEPVVQRARALGLAVEGLPADHHYVGQGAKVGSLVAAFLATHLG